MPTVKEAELQTNFEKLNFLIHTFKNISWFSSQHHLLELGLEEKIEYTNDVIIKVFRKKLYKEITSLVGELIEEMNKNEKEKREND